MRARTVVGIVAAGLGICAGLVAAYLFLLPLLLPGPDIASRLAKIDSAIAGGYLSSARDAVLAVRPFPRREADALRLLKRAFLVSRQSGDMRLLSAMSDRAIAVVGRSRTVRMIAAYAYLRVGRLADAEAAAHARLPAGAGDLVRGEIVLRRGGAWQGSDGLTRQLIGLETSRRVSDFTAAAGAIHDNRLSLDAALLSLQAGDLSGARGLAASFLLDSRYDEVAALIDYDAGDFEAAVARLTRIQSRGRPRADIALVLADCYRELGRSGELEAALLDGISADPQVSWTPYADLSLAGRRRGDFLFARSVLDRGRALFPGSRELILTAANLEAAQGDTAAAVSLLDGLVADAPDDVRAALLRLSLKAPRLSPEAYRGELWKLYDRLPADREVFMTLAAALIASHDWDGASVELREYEKAAGAQDADVLSIRGVVEAMQGHADVAMESIRQATQLPGGEKHHYDLAVLLLHGGNARAALEQLASADGDDTLRARVETLRGRCLLAIGDSAGARAAFVRARSLDPHLLRPGLELRKLEAPEVQ